MVEDLDLLGYLIKSKNKRMFKFSITSRGPVVKLQSTLQTILFRSILTVLYWYFDVTGVEEWYSSHVFL